MTEVRFCNLCDRSVPEGELHGQGALLVGGRVLCSECLPLVRRAAPGRGGGGAALAVAILAWLALAALAWQGWTVLRDLDGRQSQVALAAAGDRQEGARARAELGRSLEETRTLLAARLDDFQERQAEILKGLDERLGSLEEAFGALERMAVDLKALQERAGLLEEETAVAGDRQRALRGTLEKLRDRIQVLEDRLAQAAEAAPPGESATEPFSPEVARLLRSLQAEDPRERYDALEKLASSQDLRLLPHIYPLLADPYEFVRFLAAHTLGEWEAKAAVPHLIEALLDEKPFVAEAAVGALRRLTGQDFGFDPGGSMDDRRRIHDSWLQWWQQNGEDFLAGS